MHEEAGFLAAIRAVPDDDATRLVYADWLDEQGRPGGDFLRIGRRLSGLAHADHARRTALQADLRRAADGLEVGWMMAVSRVSLADLRPRWDGIGPGKDLPRERAYLDILHRGLVMVRNFAQYGPRELCEIEADHLHNIPRILGETHEPSHVYYILHERGLYLERLRRLGAEEYLKEVRIWYGEPWWVLAHAAGVTESE